MLRQLQRILALPKAYDLFQNSIGAPGARERFFREHVRATGGERVLDAGCGMGIALEYLPDDVRYVGLDLSEAYLHAARQAHASRDATFVHLDLADTDAYPDGPFDIVLLVGVLHHLPDTVAHDVLSAIAGRLSPAGRVVTIDPGRVPEQSSIARRLVNADRGEFVRNRDDLVAIVASHFDVASRVHHDLLRIPYTHVVTEGRRRDA